MSPLMAALQVLREPQPQQSELRPGQLGEALFDRLEFLKPANDLQTITKSQVIPMIVDLRQTQWLMYLKSQQSAVPRPLLVILVSWLAAIFVSFGLFAPRNATVIVTLALSALGVSSAIFIILEMSVLSKTAFRQSRFGQAANGRSLSPLSE
jgi:hypothetical protein